MEAVIIDALRTAVGKSPRGTLRNTRPDDMAAAVIRALLEKYPQVSADEVDDVIIGCAMPEAEAGSNMGRVTALRAGLPDYVPGMTVNRFCASGLEAISMAVNRVRAGEAEIVMAGGAESMSLIPFGGAKPAPNPWFVDHRPEVYMSMGLTAERLRAKYGVTREDADAFALRSHRNAVCAQREGRFDDEIVPLEIATVTPGQATKTVFARDEGPRDDTSLEALAKLKPVFHARGTVTAGNSSQTSDGAAVALVMSERKAERLGLKPRARMVSYSLAGVPPEIMGIGPVVAIPKALKLAGLNVEEMSVIELNEAFAVQTLAVIRHANLPMDRINPNGGAIALGHPLGCTGAKLTATLLRDLERRGGRYGMVTMCVGGGQGAAGVFERLN